MLGRLEHPPVPAPLVGEDPEHVLQVPVARRLVGRLPPVPVGGQRHDALEQHRVEVHGQQLDLLVHVVGGHLVHALEVRHGLVHEPEGQVAALPTGIGLDPPLLVGRDRLQGLPVRQRPQRRVGRHQVVQVGRAGAGQPGHDDRGLDLDVPDLGVPGQLLLDPQPVAQELDEQRVLGHEAHGAQLDVLGQRPAEDRQRLFVEVVTEVVEPLGLDGRGLQLVGDEAGARPPWARPSRGSPGCVVRTPARRGRRGRPRVDVRSWPPPRARSWPTYALHPDVPPPAPPGPAGALHREGRGRGGQGGGGRRGSTPWPSPSTRCRRTAG